MRHGELDQTRTGCLSTIECIRRGCRWPAGAIILAALIVVAPLRAGTDDDLAAALDVLRAADVTLVDVNYNDERVDEILADLTQQSGIPLLGDWTYLELYGVPPRRRVTLQQGRVPLRTALASLVIDLGDDIDRPRYTAWNGMIVLTADRELGTMAYTAAYNVGDLMTAWPNLDMPRRPSEPMDLPAPETSPRPLRFEPTDNPFDWPPEDPRESAVAGIVDLIVGHIETESWDLWGGTQAKLDTRGPTVVITAPATMHRQVRHLLRHLRRQHPTDGELDIAVIDLDRAAYQRTARRFEPDSPHLGRALIQHDETHVRYRVATPIILDRPTTLRSENDGLSIEITVNAVRARNVYTVDLTAHFAEEGGRSQRIRTSAGFPDHAGSAVIELPLIHLPDDVAEPGETDDLLRLIVIAPRDDF